MCASPNGTFLRSFFLNCFFLPFFSGVAPAAAGFAILGLCTRFLLVRYSTFARPFAGASVSVGPLPADGQVASVAVSAIRADLNQPLDVHGDVFAQIAFDAALAFDSLANAIDLVLVEILNLLVHIHIGAGEKARGTRVPDAIDVSERDIHVLIARKIDACNTCHSIAPSC